MTKWANVPTRLQYRQTFIFKRKKLLEDQEFIKNKIYLSYFYVFLEKILTKKSIRDGALARPTVKNLLNLVQKSLLNWGRSCSSSSSVWLDMMLLVLFSLLSFVIEIILCPSKATGSQPFLLNLFMAFQRGSGCETKGGLHGTNATSLQELRCGHDDQFVKAFLMGWVMCGRTVLGEALLIATKLAFNRSNQPWNPRLGIRQ